MAAMNEEFEKDLDIDDIVRNKPLDMLDDPLSNEDNDDVLKTMFELRSSLSRKLKLLETQVVMLEALLEGNYFSLFPQRDFRNSPIGEPSLQPPDDDEGPWPYEEFILLKNIPCKESPELTECLNEVISLSEDDIFPFLLIKGGLDESAWDGDEDGGMTNESPYARYRAIVLPDGTLFDGDKYEFEIQDIDATEVEADVEPGRLYVKKEFRDKVVYQGEDETKAMSFIQ